MEYEIRDYKEYNPKRNKRLIILFALILVLVIVLMYNRDMRRIETAKRVVPEEKNEVTIFFPANQQRLTQKFAEIKKGLGEQERAEAIIKELKKEKVVGTNLVLQDFMTDSDGIVYINMSHDIIEEKKSSFEEILMVHAITNSFLANYKDTKKVQLLVEGRPVYTINGVVYTYKPIEFNKELLEE